MFALQDRTDTIATKLRLLQDAYAAGKLDLGGVALALLGATGKSSTRASFIGR